MTKELQKIKRQIIPILKKAGVKKSEIFGSFARGDFNKRSDVDLIVQFKKRASFFDIVELKSVLEDGIGRKVDILTYGGIHPFIRQYVDRDRVKIL